MRRFAPQGALLAVAIVMAGTVPSHADANAAVCAQTYGKSDGLACNYATFEQCRATISGISGSCISNPYFPPNTNKLGPKQRGRR